MTDHGMSVQEEIAVQEQRLQLRGSAQHVFESDAEYLARLLALPTPEAAVEAAARRTTT